MDAQTISLFLAAFWYEILYWKWNTNILNSEMISKTQNPTIKYIYNFATKYNKISIV